MRRTFLLVIAVLAFSFFSFARVSYAVIETYEFSDSSLEQRYKSLSAELRCPKCQNQNIAASNAPISQDLRKLLYKQLEAGASDEEILDFMVARYGEFVRYKPRYSGVTLTLWVMPVVLLFAGVAIVLLMMRGIRREDRDITAAEQQQLENLLASQAPPGTGTETVEKDA